MSKQGVISFNWNELKVGDRVFESKFRGLYDMGTVVQVSAHPPGAESLWSFTTDKCAHHIIPGMYTMRLFIDRRSFFQKILWVLNPKNYSYIIYK